eukprot:357162-Chlamydomonas_euryale.AAC.2
MEGGVCSPTLLPGRLNSCPPRPRPALPTHAHMHPCPFPAAANLMMVSVSRPTDTAAYSECGVSWYSCTHSGRHTGSEMAMRKSYACACMPVG